MFPSLNNLIDDSTVLETENRTFHYGLLFHYYYQRQEKMYMVKLDAVKLHNFRSFSTAIAWGKGIFMVCGHTTIHYGKKFIQVHKMIFTEARLRMPCFRGCSLHGCYHGCTDDRNVLTIIFCTSFSFIQCLFNVSITNLNFELNY